MSLRNVTKRTSGKLYNVSETSFLNDTECKILCITCTDTRLYRIFQDFAYVASRVILD